MASTKHPPREGDLDINELADRAYPLLLAGNRVFIKWTCPSCGERVMSDDELHLVPHMGMLKVSLHSHYLHTAKDDGTPCMVSVDPRTHKFGFTVIMALR